MTIQIQYQPTSTFVMLDGLFSCMHDGDTITEMYEVTYYQGEQDCSYDTMETLCADCGEVLEDY